MNSYDRIYNMLIEGETSGGDVKATGRRVGRAMSRGKGTVRHAVNIAGRLVRKHGEDDKDKEDKIRKDYHDSVKLGASTLATDDLIDRGLVNPNILMRKKKAK